MAIGTERRPQVISTSGQGGAGLSPFGLKERKGQGHKAAGIQVQGGRGWMRLIIGVKPSASASPRHWFSIPAWPSDMTQQVRPEKGFWAFSVVLSVGKGGYLNFMRPSTFGAMVFFAVI